MRILRFFRFNARFGQGAPDAAALAACAERANDLMALSRERIAAELLALLALPEPQRAVATMIEYGIFLPVLPEIADAKPLAALVRRETENGVAADPIRRLAALLPADPHTADGVAARLKLSNAARKRLAIAADRMADADPRTLAYRLGKQAATDRLLLEGGDLAAISDWTPPRFPITGGQVVALGVKAGPEVARILKAAEAQWVGEGFPGEKRAREIVAALAGEAAT